MRKMTAKIPTPTLYQHVTAEGKIVYVTVPENDGHADKPA